MGTILLYAIYVMEETIKYCFFYYGILNLKTTTERKKYFYAVLIMMVTVGINVCFFDMRYSVTLLLCDFLCICLLIQSDWKTKILAFIPVFLIINFIDITFATVIAWIFHFNSLIILEPENMSKGICQLLPSYVILGFITLLNCNRKKSVKYGKRISWLQYLLICVGLLCSVVTTSLISYIGFTDDIWKSYWFKNWFTILAFGSVVILVLFILYIKELTGKQKIQDEMLLLYEKQALLQNEYYQRLYEQSERLKRFQHDYHHHLYLLKELLQNKKFDEAVIYIRQVEEKAVNHEISIVYSGNTVIDAVICGVLENAEIQDIQFEYRGKLKKRIGIEDIDICILLANALENAVEACGRYKGERYIKMEIATYKSNIFITICNSCEQNHKQSRKKLRTEKKDRDYHGYGIQNMKAVAEKYNGSLFYEEKEGEFTVKIHLEEQEIN